MILRALMIAAVSLTLMASADAQTKGPNGGIVVKADDHPVEFVDPTIRRSCSTSAITTASRCPPRD